MRKRGFSLGARLELCASYVRKGARVADIGTDHAYLPVWLISNGIASSAIASDINEGPIERAKEHIARYDAGDRVSTVVADGLAGIHPDSVDDIVIAGMGGELIAKILQDAPWTHSERYQFILQPMTHAERLREYLYAVGFAILNERAVIEGRRVYTVICAKYVGGSTEHTESDTYIGGLWYKKDEAAERYLSMQASLLRAEANGCNAVGDEKRAKELFAIAEVLEKG